MSTAYEGPNAEQAKNWNETSGPAWVRRAAEVGSQIRPFGERAMARLAPARGDRILDVGCGTGETTLELGKRVGSSGRVLGLDVSRPMLEHARATAKAAELDHVAFELADAQTAALPEGAFDKLFSRYGVMFFADPRAAFANLRRALRPGAEIAFVCWRSPAENPWLVLPLMAIAPLVTITPPPPDAPGPMAFADPAKVRGILEAAGFVQAALEPIDLTTQVAGTTAIDAAVEFLLDLGPAANALRGADPSLRAACAEAIRAAIAPFHGPEGVCMPAASWLVTATAP
jgi:SAM-dependent methyltransferase